jgi:hypothetical protein
LAARFPILKSAALATLLIAPLVVAPFGARADEPTPAQISAAMTILSSIGMKKSFDDIVPGMMVELENQVGSTRPELKDTLHAVIVAILPEFAKTETDVLNQGATILAGEMTEQELKDTAAFFDSPTGKKYFATMPVFSQQFIPIAQQWRQKLSTDILTRAREEMKKKGIDF